ncbi:MAG: D-alanyl-D-alanine carboxypeptidase family protein [Bacilli bacterium]
MKKKLTLGVVLITIALLMLFFLRNTQNPKEPEIQVNYTNKNENLNLSSQSSLIVNLDNDDIIYEKQMKEPIPVYSVSKIMFLYTASKKMEQEHLSYQTKVVVDESITLLTSQYDFTNAYIQPYEEYTIEDLFYAVMLPSGNDASHALSIALFGSSEAAIKAMNKEAKNLGMNNSSFVSTSGLNGEDLSAIGLAHEDGQNMMSAQDSALLLKAIKNDAPLILEIGKQDYYIIGKDSTHPIALDSFCGPIKTLPNGKVVLYSLKTGGYELDYSYSIIAIKENDQGDLIALINYGALSGYSMNQDIIVLNEYIDQLITTNNPISTKLGLKQK